MTAEKLMSDLNPAEIALLIESLPPGRREVVWKLIAESDEGDVLAELNDEVRTPAHGKTWTRPSWLAVTEGMPIG